MKFLPIKFRENMEDFFGKKGFSWHVACIITLSESSLESGNKSFDVLTLVHVVQEGQQGWFTVAHLIRDIIDQVKVRYPNVNEIFLKSDNAGCYHSSALIAFLFHLNINASVKVLEYNFSEPQSGKDICDAKTSHCKMHIFRYRYKFIVMYM